MNTIEPKVKNVRPKNTRLLNGYVVLYRPKHPSAMTSENWKGYIYEHILVAEEMLGRSLSDDEIVHHLNMNRADNRPRNLLVLLKSQHGKLHRWIDSVFEGIEYPSNRKSKARTKSDSDQEWSDAKRMNSEKPRIIKGTPKLCILCSKPVMRATNIMYCSYECSHKATRKVERPTYNQLLQDIGQMSVVKVGQKYGVSDNAIRKWLRYYESTPSQAIDISVEGVETTGEVQSS